MSESTDEQPAPRGIPSSDAISAAACKRTGSPALDLLALQRRMEWLKVARPAQLPPTTDYATWVLMTGRGFGKRLNIDTEVPVSKGFKKNGDLEVGDILIGSRGQYIRVEEVHPIEEAVECYRVTFDDGSFIDADAEHLWTTHTKLNRKNYSRNSKPIVETTLNTKQIKNTLLYLNREANHAVPVVRVRGSYQELSLDPYFLGVWLGGGMSSEAAIICGENDELIFDRLQTKGYEINHVRWTNPQSKNGRSWPIYSFLNVYGKLKSLGVFGNKNIPIPYLRATIEQRFELLRGLMDTDGSVTKSAGVCELSLSNERLAKDAYHLICSLGFKATIKSYASWRYLNGKKFRQGKDRWRIHFYAYDDEPVFTLPHKVKNLLKRKGQNQLQSYRYIKSVERIAPIKMRCITVSDEKGLYCVTPSCILTHNTRSAAEDVWWEAINNPGFRTAVIAPTFDDIRHTVFEGESGILACCPDKLISSYNRSLFTLEFINGSLIRGFSSEKPDRLRGPQHHRAWCEEVSSWQNADETWTMMNFGLRLGKNPQKLVTTTPKPMPLIKQIVEDKSSIIARGSTYDNKSNLPSKFFDELIQYEGTTIGRQELHGELIDLEEMGIFKRSWFRMWPSSVPFPAFELIVQSWDTAMTEKTENDPTACTTWGLVPASEGSPNFRAILCDAWSEHLAYPDLRERAMREFQVKYGPNERRPDIVLIEDKGSGITLRQDLQRAGIPVRKYNPGKADKTQRAHTVSHLVKDGALWIPESSNPKRKGQFRDWAEPMIEELCYFPNVTHDDYTDTVTQFLALMRDMSYMQGAEIKEEETSYWRRLAASQGRGSNPYSQ